MDAFPELSKAYSIALAIPISSCTAERSCSALKRVKTRLRSTVMQERLDIDGLLLIAAERKILKTINSDAISVAAVSHDRSGVTGKMESLKNLHPRAIFPRNFGTPTPIFLGNSASL